MNREPSVYCERVLQEDIAVAYLRGDLPEAERDAFEQHTFECADCFERLQVVRALQGVLRREAEAGRGTAVVGRRRGPGVGWLAWAAGAAFVAVGATMILRNMPPPGPVPTTAPTASASVPTAQPSVTVTTPARLEPPLYAPLIVRGAAPPDTPFTKAMEAYVRGDYPAAASGLRAALEEDPADAEARFYLGVSELVAGRSPEAVRELDRVATGDDTGFAEAARYYLAHAYLAQRDVAAARRELRRVAHGDGDHKEQAQRLLQELGVEP
jgi:tetratricopeptide (TPR) repeat protein